MVTSGIVNWPSGPASTGWGVTTCPVSVETVISGMISPEAGSDPKINSPKKFPKSNPAPAPATAAPLITKSGEAGSGIAPMANIDPPTIPRLWPKSAMSADARRILDRPPKDDTLPLRAIVCQVLERDLTDPPTALSA